MIFSGCNLSTCPTLFTDAVTRRWSSPLKNRSAQVPIGARFFERTSKEKKRKGGAGKRAKKSGMPCPRGGHAAVNIHETIFIIGGFGGFDYKRSELNDVYKMNMKEDTFKWTKVETSGKGPEPRSGHSCNNVGKTIYLFGGWSKSQQFNDLCILDTVTNTWSSPELQVGSENQNSARGENRESSCIFKSGCCSE